MRCGWHAWAQCTSLETRGAGGALEQRTSWSLERCGARTRLLTHLHTLPCLQGQPSHIPKVSDPGLQPQHHKEPLSHQHPCTPHTPWPCSGFSGTTVFFPLQGSGNEQAVAHLMCMSMAKVSPDLAWESA